MSKRMTVAEWVRRALRVAKAGEPATDAKSSEATRTNRRDLH